MNDEDRKILILHGKRSMARLTYKIAEALRFGVVKWFGQWEPDLAQVRGIQDHEIARRRREMDDEDDA